MTLLVDLDLQPKRCLGLYDSRLAKSTSFMSGGFGYILLSSSAVTLWTETHAMLWIALSVALLRSLVRGGGERDLLGLV